MAAPAPAGSSRPPIVVATLLKNTPEVVRVQLTEYRGHNLLDVRIYDEHGFPSKSGVSVQVNHLPAVAEAVEAATREAQRPGLLHRDLVPERLRPPPA